MVSNEDEMGKEIMREREKKITGLIKRKGKRHREGSPLEISGGRQQEGIDYVIRSE